MHQWSTQPGGKDSRNRGSPRGQRGKARAREYVGDQSSLHRAVLCGPNEGSPKSHGRREEDHQWVVRLNHHQPCQSALRYAHHTILPIR